MTGGEAYNYIDFSHRKWCRGQADNYSFYDQNDVLVGIFDPYDCVWAESDLSTNNTFIRNSTSLTNQTYTKLKIRMEPSLTQYGADGYMNYFGQINLSYVSFTENYLPYFNVTPEYARYCINMTNDFPVYINLNWSVVDLEGDTVQYSVDYIGLDKKYYKDYNVHHSTVWGYFQSYDIDFDSLSDDRVYYINESTYCNFCDDFVCSNSDNELTNIEIWDNDYSIVPSGWDAGVLQLKNDCEGYDVYTIRTDWFFKEFHYNTSIYALRNGENYTIQFLDQDFNDVVNLLVKGDLGNLTLSLKDSLGNYQEVYNYITDYNLTSFDIVYNDDDKNVDLRGHSKTDPISLISDSYVANPLDELDFIRYVMINFTDSTYLVQSMYSYSGVAQALDWTTVQPANVPVYNPGTVSLYFHVKDTLHDSYSTESFSIKVEQAEYCFIGQTDYPVLDSLIANPINNFFDYFGLKDEYRIVMYWLFFGLILLFIIGSYKRNHEIELFTSILISSFLCFLISFVLKDKPTMVVFMVTFVFSLIMVGIKK